MVNKRIKVATMAEFSTSQWFTVTGLLLSLGCLGLAALLTGVSWLGTPRGFYPFQSKIKEAEPALHFPADSEPRVPEPSF